MKLLTMLPKCWNLLLDTKFTAREPSTHKCNTLESQTFTNATFKVCASKEETSESKWLHNSKSDWQRLQDLVSICSAEPTGKTMYSISMLILRSDENIPTPAELQTANINLDVANIKQHLRFRKPNELSMYIHTSFFETIILWIHASQEKLRIIGWITVSPKISHIEIVNLLKKDWPINIYQKYPHLTSNWKGSLQFMTLEEMIAQMNPKSTQRIQMCDVSALRWKVVPRYFKHSRYQ